MSRRTQKTPEMIERFLKRLRWMDGNATAAARSLGLQIGTVNVWKERDPEFAARWDAVRQEAKAA